MGAGILGIYGLIVSLLIASRISSATASASIKDVTVYYQSDYSSFQGYMHLGAGLAAGLASLSAGLTIGIVGDTSVRAFAKQDAIFVAMILMLIFAEALGLYGLIIGLIMLTRGSKPGKGVC